MNLHSVLFAPAAEQGDLLIAALYELGTLGIIEEGDQIRAFFEDEVDYSGLLSTFLVLEMRREGITSAPILCSTDCDPVLVGTKFFIVPALSSQVTPQGRHRLTMDDTAAFGTGRHETTQIMLTALEQTVKAGQTVLDIGAGTGILSRAAHLLGARQVWSCDIYEEAVQSALRHFGLPVFIGSADAIRDHVADITLANISPRVLDAIAYDLKRVSARKGQVLVSGFLRGSEPKRFKPETVWEQEEWLCWLCRPENIDADRGDARVVIHSQEWWQ